MATAQKRKKWKDKIDRVTRRVDSDIVGTIATAIGQVSDGLDRAATADVWHDWLDTAAKMHRYSATNQLLIRHQDPNATLVAGESDWKRLGFEPVDRPARITVLARVPGKSYKADKTLTASDLTSQPPSGRRKRPRTVVTVGGRTLEAFIGRNGDVMVENGTKFDFRPAASLDISQVRPVDGTAADAADLVADPQADIDPAAVIDALTSHAAAEEVTVEILPDLPGAATRRVAVDSRTVQVRTSDPTRTAIDLIAGLAELQLRTDEREATDPRPAGRRRTAVQSAAYAVACAAGLDTTGWALPSFTTFLAGTDSLDDTVRAEQAKDRMKEVYSDVVAVTRRLVPALPAATLGGKLPYRPAA